MTADMKPTVPPELIEVAFKHYSMHGEGLVHNILAAVLPEHERMVRNQIARDLLEERRKVAEQEGATQRDNDVINGICNGLITAVRIAGGAS